MTATTFSSHLLVENISDKALVAQVEALILQCVASNMEKLVSGDRR